MMALKRPLLIACVVLAAVAAQPAALAHTGHGVFVVLEAGEAGDCPDGSYCFDVVRGDLADITPGADVELELENPEDNGIQHNAHVARLADRNQGGNTPTTSAFANTEDVDPGQTTTINFTVPTDADEVYIWCTIAGHESGGMWITSGEADGGSADGNGSPGFTALGALAGIGFALLAHRRRE